MIISKITSFYITVNIILLAYSIGGCQKATSTITADYYDGQNTNVPHFTEQLFDSDWHFHRGDVPGAESPDFDDSQWRILDLPHDWTIEDLPSKEDSIPEYPVVKGTWYFHKGDNPDWNAIELDESEWQQVSLPDTWENHSDYNENNVYGWFRRNIDIPDNCIDRDFDLLLGCIDDADETWLNGVRIGSTGTFPPDYQTAWNVERRYRIPASLVKGDGSDVLAVRIFDGNGDGGIYQAESPSIQIGPFNPSESTGKHFTGNTVGGIGWYRKHFTIDEADKKVSVCFDGVYMNSEIWLNGHRLGEHPHGYTGFIFDLTPFLNAPGQDNVISVKVRNEGRNSRWYSGSGIYRHVWLSVNEPIHIPTWGVFVTTPQVSTDKAEINTSVEVQNISNSLENTQINISIKDSNGNIINNATKKLKVEANNVKSTETNININNPKLWSIDSPYLYTAEVKVIIAGKITDMVTTPFGIRKIEIDAKNGFRLNGKHMNLKGGCIHHDNGPLGSAAIDRAEYRRIELLKANGYNAIRCSHNPPSSALLDACDRLGMMVIDEAFDQWTRSKENNQQDYNRFFNDWYAHDIAAMVRRDRNHPSVIMWSIGNEIPEQFQAEQIQKQLREAVLSHDPTRPITQAICSDWGRVAANWSELSDPAFKYLDVAGYNYLPQHYEADHDRHPDRVIVTTESYPKDTFEYWSLVEDHPYIIGDFVWTAMDYLGEAGLAHITLNTQNDTFFKQWPWFNAWCGDLDLCGFKKPQSYYRDVVWRRSLIEMAVLAPLPDGFSAKLSSWAWPNEYLCWNWRGHEGKTLQVSVYSRCDSVRLELNGKVIGEKPVSDATRLTARFDVPYTPGKLCAYGLVDGKVVAQSTLTTAGLPNKLKLTADRTIINASRNDLSYITVEIVDSNGNLVPDAEMPVQFSVTGDGELAGQASGIPNKPASFKIPYRKTFRGRCLAILRPTGDAGQITLTAKAEGLEPATITILTKQTQ